MWEELLDEADLAFPLETGGVLMGYWVEPRREVVVTDVIGPGPNATHASTGFLPDAKYQEGEIDRIYLDSGRLITYLGDWHTHPLGSCSLSFKDKRTLHHIANFGDARCHEPLMAVLGGGKDGEWLVRIWKYAPHILPRLFGFVATTLSPIVYENRR